MPVCQQLFSLVFSRMISTIFTQDSNAEKYSYIYMGLFFAIGIMQVRASSFHASVQCP